MMKVRVLTVASTSAHETLGKDLVSGSVLAGMSNLAASTTMLGA
jgi:hypothetical protein